MALPNGIEPKSKDQWLALANSTDATQRKQVTDCLRGLGLSSPDYMPWDAAKRVDYIMEKQGADAGGGGAKEETKASSKKDKNEAASSGSTGGGGGMTAADRALLKEVGEKLDTSIALNRKIHDLLVVQIFSNPQVKANAEEMDIKVDLLGNG